MERYKVTLFAELLNIETVVTAVDAMDALQQSVKEIGGVWKSKPLSYTSILVRRVGGSI